MGADPADIKMLNVYVHVVKAGPISLAFPRFQEKTEGWAEIRSV